MNTSNMLLRNVTCIDHAYIDETGAIVGGSFHQEIVVSGPVDEHEQVVVDFSKVKKQIKQIIDGKEYGYDHKLWVIGGFSKILEMKMKYSGEPLSAFYQITTDKVSVILPADAVKIIRNPYGLTDLVSIVETRMEEELEVGLCKANGVEIDVELTLTREVFSNGTQPEKFTYFHGLKNSSSWGCNNIAHGHTSFVEVKDDEGNRIKEAEFVIAKYLDGAMMVFQENIYVKHQTPNDIVINYKTKERGNMSLAFNPKLVKYIVMDKETTIENIVEHVAERFKDTLAAYDAKSLFISEGLQKGAIKML